MEEAFGYVLFGVVIVAAIAAVAGLAGARRTYDDIGKGGLFVDDRSAAPPASAGAAAERDAEIRQMLAARNARRTARGEPPLDVEAELARLIRPAADHSLREEIRALVQAQNRRRVRQGGEPLDVDAEVERQLRELNTG
jgi:hypothetical protein